MLPKNRPPLQALRMAVLCGLLGWLLGAGLLASTTWALVELKLFDLVTVATAPRKSSLPITIVGIDEASFAQLRQRWPWPRDLHAKLVDRLKAAGAMVIAFDVLFPESGTPAEDEALAAAVRSAGNVVMAADFSFHETASARQWLRVDPVPAFTTAGAVAGLTTVQLDPDTVIRLMPTDDETFWRQVTRTLLRVRPGLLPEPYVEPGSLIRHLGPARTFPYVSYYQVIHGDPAIPRDFFADQIVLVGRDVRAALDSDTSRADALATPFLRESKLLTPGVEVQATILENALMGQALRPATWEQNMAVLSVLLLLALPALAWWHPVRSGLVVAVLAAALVGMSVWLFTNWLQWQYTGAPLAGLLVAYIGTGTGSYLSERRRAGHLRSAFSRYVSADVVNQIIASPTNLRLGGERRELTVLFTDLAGFTSISEQLTPEAVADLVNLYLNEVTAVIMQHGGTVDKYVGDAVMAFWNAPLDDDLHALHATQAAMRMQDAMDALQPRFRALGVPHLTMRVGLHTGPAIVGNMGSDLRFTYTALGDTVNLASRLEGANKAYGTRILLSAATAAAMHEAVPVRRVDRVKVKGRSLPVDIFTPCPSRRLVQNTAAAWDAYAQRDWPRAVQAWMEVAQAAPKDPLAALFLERVRRLRVEPPVEDWDGATQLD